MHWKTPFTMAWQTVTQSFEDNVPLLAAGVAFYALISIAPLMIIVIAVAGLVFGQDAAEGQIVAELADLMGQEGARVIQEMVRRSSQPSASITATAIGVFVLLFGAMRLFGALQTVLNSIWGVHIKSTSSLVGGVLATLRDRFFSLLMVLGTVFLLLTSLVVSAALTAVITYFRELLPSTELIWRWASFLVGFVITTGIFAAILRGVPDVVLRWRDVAVGAVVTSLLFSLGRYLMGMYLGGGSFGSVYGAAASLVIILFWIYYSVQILCLGAEFTKLYVRRFGGDVETRKRAEFMSRGTDPG
jgi:membrane protein